ncbi:hypothetical protein [Parasphingopyxis sp.]|uniref:hypothetical protein n=1 Tax=Parasphingopyxis sp. TaxID=1920299 RepID=UPI00261CD7B4|nr:hypothetical protein [Parasphingopyxis sp.]
MSDVDLTVEVIEKPDRMRNVVIIKRPDGHFSYYEALGEGDQTKYEMYPDFTPWPKMVETAGISETVESAKKDASSRIDWFQL